MSEVKGALRFIGFCLFLFVMVKILIFLIGQLAVAMSKVSKHLSVNWNIYLSVIILVILCASVLLTYWNVSEQNKSLNFTQKIGVTSSRLFKVAFQAILLVVVIVVILGLFFGVLGGMLEYIRSTIYSLFN